MTRDEVIEELRRANPGAREQDMRTYADAYTDYQTAQANIDEHGQIVMHPRTGAPIDNPYLKVRDAAAARLGKYRLDSDALWR